MRRHAWIQTGYALLMGLAVLSAGACRKDLCYAHDEHAFSVKVEPAFSWERAWERAYQHQWKEEWKAHWSTRYDDLLPERADGVRALIYSDHGYTDERHLPPEGGRLPMRAGTHTLLFYNNDTEYIVFNGLQASATATASTRTLTRKGFEEMHRHERTVTPPDMLFGHFLEGYEAVESWEPVALPVTLRPLVYTYYIRYEFSSGQDYVALARGALAGMAERVYLSDGHTDHTAATVLFDGLVTDYGAEARVHSFGVPNYPGDHYTREDGTPAQFMLNLEVRLKNGKFKTLHFNVTDQVLKQPRGGVIVADGITITEEEGGGGGGFDVEVDGWGDYIDIPLPLHGE